MKIFKINFLVYNLCGLWRPSKWSSKGAKLLYNVYTSIVIFLEYFMALTQFLDIILVVDNIDDFATNTLMFLTIVAVCCKATIVGIRQNAIQNLVQSLMRAPCNPLDEKEAAIQKKFDKFIRSIMLKYLFLAVSSHIGVTIGQVFNIMQGQIPHRVWLPFNYNVPSMFWIISIQQVITILSTTIINTCTDTLIYGMILQTCAQLEIFENRINKLIIKKTVRYLGNALSLSNESNGISECVRHHLIIYKYARTVNFIFNQVVFVQFCASILLICTNVYFLSIHMSDLTQAATLVVYTIGMFVQIYIYCWTGNEVTLKSTSVGDAIYCMDWPLLSAKERKELLLIMIRTTIPIKFNSGFIITLSLQSYSNILKTSYSAFNLLHK